MQDINSITLRNTTYYYHTNLKGVDLANVPWENNSMSMAFANCNNLEYVNNINENVTNMDLAFANCYKMNVPVIPNSVIDMRGAFASDYNLNGELPDLSNCSNLTNIADAFHLCYDIKTTNKPVLPDSIIDMAGAFEACFNMTKAPEIPNNVKYMQRAFLLDKNISEPPSTIPNSVINMANAFGDCSKLLNVPNMDNAVNVVDMAGAFFVCYNITKAPNLSNCTNLTNMRESFHNCFNLIDASMNIPNSVNDMMSTFANCQSLINAPDMSNATGLRSLQTTFSGCAKLVNAPVLPNSIITMSGTFSRCSNLVNAPVIPNSVTDIYQTFMYCFNLVNAPIIPNSVREMYSTFEGCHNLTNVPLISNSVTNLSRTFIACNHLVNAPEIPSSVINMTNTFCNCTSLVGDVFIRSENIASAFDCFYNTSLEKNVYIPFTYDNGVNTTTYNSFMTAGYSDTTRKHGVLLFDINEEDIDLTDYEYNVSENNDVTLTKYIGSNSVVVTPHLI